MAEAINVDRLRQLLVQCGRIPKIVGENRSTAPGDSQAELYASAAY